MVRQKRATEKLDENAPAALLEYAMYPTPQNSQEHLRPISQQTWRYNHT